MKDIDSIHTEEEYDATMTEVISLAKSNPAKGSSEYEKLIRLSMLIEEYDHKQ
ncbi:MAG: hypothetical protein JXR78_10285 [Victivallales bacterium]|nr:hypothetical protein [Victivallales bacterium]